MTLPIVTSRNIKSSGPWSHGTVEFFVNGVSVGQFDYHEEDASAGSVEQVFDELDGMGIVDFQGGAS